MSYHVPDSCGSPVPSTACVQGICAKEMVLTCVNF